MARRRKSESLISNLAHGQEKPVPELFNLIDLVLTSLRSRNQQTVTATLRLVCVLLRNRHQYNFSLVKTHVVEDGQISRSLETHDRDIAMLFSICEDLADSDSLGEGYEAQLVDVQNVLESHECSSWILALPSAPLEMAKPAQIQSMKPEDPLLTALLNLLRGFMASDVETNLALTQTLSTLASCGSLRLDGWLVGTVQPTTSPLSALAHRAVEPSFGDGTQVAAESKDENSRTESNPLLQVAEPVATEKGNKGELMSPVFAALDSLLAQVETFRREISNFDVYLSERKHVFKVGEDIDNAVTSEHFLARQSEEEPAPMAPPPKPRGVPQIGSINERLLSTETSAQGSRASSPRGRQPEVAAGPTLAGRLSHLRVSPSPSPSSKATRSDARAVPPSPSPLRNGSVSSTPPNRTVTPIGPADALKQKVKVLSAFEGDIRRSRDFSGSSETSSVKSESTAPDHRDISGYREVSLSRILTNVIILQEFIVELAAIVQVRASLFGEVSFS